MTQKQFKEIIPSRFPELSLTIRELGNNIEAITNDGKYLFQGSRYSEKIRLFMNGNDCGEVIY